jgi:hypothetical protein
MLYRAWSALPNTISLFRRLEFENELQQSIGLEDRSYSRPAASEGGEQNKSPGGGSDEDEE